ncbi:MAG: hypothetical protein ACOCTT_00875 [archaeon]
MSNHPLIKIIGINLGIASEVRDKDKTLYKFYLLLIRELIARYRSIEQYGDEDRYKELISPKPLPDNLEKGEELLYKQFMEIKN